MQNENESESSETLPYSAPKLRVIELVTDEVLGVGCKTVSDVVPTGLCGTTPCGAQVGS